MTIYITDGVVENIITAEVSIRLIQQSLIDSVYGHIRRRYGNGVIQCVDIAKRIGMRYRNDCRRCVFQVVVGQHIQNDLVAVLIHRITGIGVRDRFIRWVRSNG